MKKKYILFITVLIFILVKTPVYAAEPEQLKAEVNDLYANHPEKTTTRLFKDILFAVTNENRQTLDTVYMDVDYDNIILSYPEREYKSKNMVSISAYANHCQTVLYNGTAYIRDKDYRFNQEDKDKTAAAIDIIYADAVYLKSITEGLNEADKANAIDAFIAKKYRYDYSFNSKSARDMALTGKGTCGAFAALAYTYCNYCGLDCEGVVGKNEDANAWHAWIEVNINGESYYIDASGDSIRNEAGTQMKGIGAKEDLLKWFSVIERKS